jgi:hypothetical protein
MRIMARRLERGAEIQKSKENRAFLDVSRAWDENNAVVANFSRVCTFSIIDREKSVAIGGIFSGGNRSENAAASRC